MGGHASDWGLLGCSGPPVGKKSLRCLHSSSFLPAKAQSWRQTIALDGASARVCVRAYTRVCLALQTQSRWGTKGSRLVQHSEIQFSLLVCGLDPSFEVWERVGENKCFFIDLRSNIRFSLQKRAWNGWGHLESQTSGLALWEGPTGKNSAKPWIIQVSWTKKLFY